MLTWYSCQLKIYSLQEEYRFPEQVPVPEPRPQPQLIDKVTTLDAHEGPNGVLEVVEKHTEGVVNCVSEPPVPAELSIPPPPQPPPAVEGQPKVPKLFDMDLERMHVELHKNRYLTPQGFLDDVRKMVHNAAVCQSEDLERLHRAQAMYTATEVSMQDFDPQFRTECERMAERERQRRAARKKEKEKAKERSPREADAGSETYAPGTRRSARHNGQEPEIAITDVTKLERAARLKRQRSTGPSSQASGDEISDGRNAKRSRVNSEEDVSMNTNLPEPCSTQQLSTAVSTVYLSCPQPTSDSADPSGSGGLLPDVPPSAMGGGFDPSLLNPAPSHSDQSPHHHRRFFTPSSGSASAAPDPTPDPMTVDAQPPRFPSPALPLPESAQSSELHPTSEPLISNPDVPAPMPPITGESPAPASPVPECDFEAIEVDREPTPREPTLREPTPLPDFHFDQNALTHLGDDLRDMTGLLNVEQLEQLRASCLGCIWAHRSDWDRDNLILELGKISRDFAEEVRADHEGEAMVSP